MCRFITDYIRTKCILQFLQQQITCIYVCIHAYIYAQNAKFCSIIQYVTITITDTRKWLSKYV